MGILVHIHVHARTNIASVAVGLFISFWYSKIIETEVLS